MRRKFLISLLLVLFIIFPKTLLAASCGDFSVPGGVKLVDFWRQVGDDCKQKIQDSQNQEQTLKAAISVIESRVRLTNAQIMQTSAQISQLEKDIDTLSTVVTDLDKNLTDLTKVFLARVRAGYMRRDPSPISLFFSSDSFAKFFTRIRYLSIVKARDQLVLSEIESAKINYDSQKQAKTVKQKQVADLRTQLEVQQLDLSRQQKAKKNLLVTTQNDESRYQKLLSDSLAELNAIKAILANQDQETSIRDVNQGDVIAHISGSLCNSTGPHLHFTVANNGVDKNPFDFLKPSDHLDKSGGDLWNPTGSWNWPLSGTIRFNQGYGFTWAIRNRGLWYSWHNGVDISSNSDEVHAVRSGRLYQGIYTGNNSCPLQYVRVHHKDDGLDTYYLHINYI